MRNVIICLSAILVAMTIVTVVATQKQIEIVYIQYWPSIKEMQEWSGAPVDGIWGDLTEDAYVPKQKEWYCNYMYQQSMKGFVK